MATPLLTYVGYTPGQGAGETHATPDLAGFQTAYKNTGPGAPPNGSGAQYSRCLKYFPGPGETSANGVFPVHWSDLVNLSAIIAAATTPVFVLIAFGSKPNLLIPTQSQLQGFIQSVPAGLQCGFVYVSEVEAGTDLSASQYVSNVQTFSGTLNTVLANLRTSTGNGFYQRANFPIVHSARMDHYSSTGVPAGNPVTDTSYIPNAGTCDCYGADLYVKNASSARPASTDARFQGFVNSVHAKIGTNVSFGFPEYGIDSNGYTDAQKAAKLAADFTYMTGSSRPGVLPVMFWNYWYQVGNAGEHYIFDGVSQPQTLTQWQSMVAYSESQTGQNTITVANPGLQTSIVGQAVSLQISATDSNPALPLLYSLGNTLLPAGLHLNANTGLITGAPTTPGTTAAISVTVTDGTGASGSSGTFSWQVNSPTTETVTMINPGTQTSTRHTPISPVNIQASDSRGLTLTYTQLNLPAGLTINSMNGQITGIPTTVSAPLVTVTATSPTPVAASQNFTWNIIPSVVTVANPGNQTNVTNDVVSLQVTATDTAPLSVTFSATGLPTGLSISAAGLITGTCTAGGTFNTVITGTDTDGSTGQAALTWTVQAIVVTVTGPGNVINNTFDAVSLQMIGTDSADQALTWSDGGTLPPGLTIGSSTGLITGQPTTAGIYQVTITATDVSLVTGSATFTWTINQAATVLVVSIAPAAGTDIYGNAYLPGITVGKAGGTQTTIGLNGTLRYNAPVFTMPAMVNGWSVGGHATYALDVLGNLVVSFKDLLTGTDADGTLIWPQGSLPRGFRPANSRRIAAYTDQLRSPVAGNTGGCALNFLPDGSIACYGVALAATRVDLFHVIPLTF